MGICDYNKANMQLVEKALGIYDENTPNVRSEAYFTGFRDAVYNRAKDEKDPGLKKVFNQFARLLGPNHPTINQPPDQEGNDKFETFMKGKGSLKPEELLKEIKEQFGRPPTSVTMFDENIRPTGAPQEKYKGPKQ